MSVCREIEIRRIKTQTFKTKIEKNYSKEETRIDSEERKDIQKLVSIIENKDDSFDQDKTISFTKCNKKSTIDNTPIDVLL